MICQAKTQLKFFFPPQVYSAFALITLVSTVRLYHVPQTYVKAIKIIAQCTFKLDSYNDIKHYLALIWIPAGLTVQFTE